MLSRNTETKLNKGFIKTGDLQRKIFELRNDDPTMTPVDAAHALLRWFQKPENEFVRLDVLKYAISHMWGTVTNKIDDNALRGPQTPQSQARVAALSQEAAANDLKRRQSKTQIAKAANKAVEQIVATLKLMTFDQARLMHGATSKLDLSRGRGDQLLGDVFTEDEIRKAVG